MNRLLNYAIPAVLAAIICCAASAQRYKAIDKSIAVVGGLAKGGRWVKVMDTEDFIAKSVPSRKLPWRVFVIADAPSGLCEADIVYALAEPAEKLLREADSAKKPAVLVVDIYADGNFAVKDLLIDGKPLRELLTAPPKAKQK